MSMRWRTSVHILDMSDHSLPAGWVAISRTSRCFSLVNQRGYGTYGLLQVPANRGREKTKNRTSAKSLDRERVCISCMMTYYNQRNCSLPLCSAACLQHSVCNRMRVTPGMGRGWNSCAHDSSSASHRFYRGGWICQE